MRFQWLALVVLILALVMDHTLFWRRFERRVVLDAAKARRTLWSQWMMTLWTCSMLVLGMWIAQDVPLSSVGFTLPIGWRLWVPVILIAAVVSLQASAVLKIAKHSGPKSKLRDQLGSTGLVTPHEAAELPAWLGVSLTAGFCEELLFRGFLVWILQPYIGWLGAAAVSLAVFTAAHAYQGASGLVRCATLGAIMTAIVFLTQSLWPAIVLHAALDWMGGLVGWQIMRDPVARSRNAEAVICDS